MGLAQDADSPPPHQKKEMPVISFGTSMPMYVNMVGATSATPPSLRLNATLQSTGTAATKGTAVVECEVIGEPSGNIIVSQLPWSATMKSPTPALAHASWILPMQVSVCAAASTALSKNPVWPTMSGGARLQISSVCTPASISRTIASATGSAAIFGSRSYVATFGESFSSRTSPSKGSSRPPLKKKVTWAYFSVSATWNCVSPSLDTVSHSPFDWVVGGKTMGDVKAELYSVIWTHIAGLRSTPVSNLGLTATHSNISRARSERKLKHTYTSPSAIPPSATSPVGSMNSSFSGGSFAYLASSTAFTPPRAVVAHWPGARHMTSYPFFTRSQRLSRSIAQ
mmetsp:Transcript_65288/g.145709  ORF Transcript_65288/g.145709 Transcript_65288/m.145709 type:complete len:340 (-) Transcript_65288:630-1649(-)